MNGLSWNVVVAYPACCRMCPSWGWFSPINVSHIAWWLPSGLSMRSDWCWVCPWFMPSGQCFVVHLWGNQMCFSSHECWPHGAEFMLLDAFSGWDWCVELPGSRHSFRPDGQLWQLQFLFLASVSNRSCNFRLDPQPGSLGFSRITFQADVSLSVVCLFFGKPTVMRWLSCGTR